ncbi:helicase [Penicillium herquei]|nr:helicase [Penicillium herquei]
MAGSIHLNPTIDEQHGCVQPVTSYYQMDTPTPNSSLFPGPAASRSGPPLSIEHYGTNIISNSSASNIASIKEPTMFQDVPSVRLDESVDSTFASSSDVNNIDQHEPLKLSNEICYGSICDIHVELRKGPSSEIHNQERIHSFDILPGPENFVICSSSTNEAIGFLNRGISVTLKALQKVGQIRLETSFTTSEWSSMALSKSTTAQDTVDISIIGAKDQSDAVGDYLSHAGLFLQSPRFDSGVPYCSPHMISFSDILESEDETAELNDNLNDAESGINRPSTDALSNILDNLQQHTYLQQLASDHLLAIPLLPHQKEGVDFMTRREVGESTSSLSFWHAKDNNHYERSYSHSITGLTTKDPPPGPFGGILADEMGLGKTLTTLATIISTLKYAETTMNTGPPDLCGISSRHRSKATLIIVPSEVLMNQWLDEIRQRVKPGVLVTCRYHGQSRKSQLSSLQQRDVILTTYGTVTSEYSRKNGLLHSTEFFRVVLDEAHEIRTRSSQRFAAVSAISASRRWCITGTPIQNQFEDLGTLISFLRVPYLSEPEMFRTHIINPAYHDDSTRFDNLRLLLGCICLRRTKDTGHLADPKFEVIRLNMSPSETQAYNEIVERHREAMDRSVSTCNSAAASHHIFQALLKLRLLCNHGLYKRVTLQPGNAHLDPDEVFSILQLRNEAQCAICSTGIWFLAKSLLPEAGTFAQCGHLICGRCSNALNQKESPRPSSLEVCSTCQSTVGNNAYSIDYVSRGFLTPKSGSIDPEQRSPGPIPDAIYPTKLHALLNSIQSHPDEKCIVFSGWKKTLDIVAIFMDQCTVRYATIDGSVPNPERLRVLSNFNVDPGLNVLLMTIATGAVGLNLTSATRVHILEPQWNPMVEQQAIGRVVRIGQMKDVVVTRYIMRQTVEESVLSSQEFKLQVAMKGFQARNSSQNDDQRMKNLRRAAVGIIRMP